MRSGGLCVLYAPLGSSASTRVTDVTKTKIRKERRARQRQQHQRVDILPQAQPHQILSFRQWCHLNAISPRTGRRILAGEYGAAPVVTQLSPKRIGISYGANTVWQASRERAA
jgi:hypothetical protein